MALGGVPVEEALAAGSLLTGATPEAQSHAVGRAGAVRRSADLALLQESTQTSCKVETSEMQEIKAIVVFL